MSERKAFTDFEFVPADGLRNKSYSPTEPENEESIRDQIQGIPDQLRDHINALQLQLSSSEPGNSGADYIGAAPTRDIHGNTISEQMAYLRDQINEASMGQIPDGSITSAKIASGAVGAIQLADGSVSTAKLAGGVVTSAKLANGAVTSEKISDSAITGAKIANGSITDEKLGAVSGITQKAMILESCDWTVPVSALYRFTLYGGGGGGGSGFYAEISGMNPAYHWFGGAGGSASVPVSRELFLEEGTVCTFEIGKGGKGHNSANVSVSGSGSSARISYTDASEEEGEESQLIICDAVILETSERIYAEDYRDATSSSASGTPGSQFGGQPGAGLAGSDVGSSQSAALGYFSSLDPTPGKMGGGDGAGYVKLGNNGNTHSNGGSASWYGCGGGGGGSTYSNKNLINSGGDGMDGVAIIEWTV